MTNDIEFFETDLLQMSKSTNYIKWQLNLIRPYVYGQTLEIGGGIGNITVPLSKHVEHVTSIEPDSLCFERLTEQTSGIVNITCLNVSSENVYELFGKDILFDTIISTNVLEHIADDKAALQSYCKLLKPGGTLVIIVPAGQWAYGEIDSRLGHFRRYTRSNLERLVRSLPFETVVIKHFNSIGLFGWFWNNKVAKKNMQSDFQIHVFDKILVPFLSAVEKFIPTPFGQSLLFVAKRIVLP